MELKEPALQLMQVIEADPDDSFVETGIRELAVKSLDEVATSEEVQRRFQPILKAASGDAGNNSPQSCL